jgi:hypothetical protein
MEAYLVSVELERYLPVMLENEIDIETLCLFEKEDLKEIAMPLGPIVKIRKTLPAYMARIQRAARREPTCEDDTFGVGFELNAESVLSRVLVASPIHSRPISPPSPAVSGGAVAPPTLQKSRRIFAEEGDDKTHDGETRIQPQPQPAPKQALSMPPSPPISRLGDAGHSSGGASTASGSSPPPQAFAFQCTSMTQDECIHRQLLGGPCKFERTMTKQAFIKKGTLLLLYNFDKGYCYLCLSAGAWANNIERDAWSNCGNLRFPFQVRISGPPKPLGKVPRGTQLDESLKQGGWIDLNMLPKEWKVGASAGDPAAAGAKLSVGQNAAATANATYPASSGTRSWENVRSSGALVAQSSHQERVRVVDTPQQQQQQQELEPEPAPAPEPVQEEWSEVTSTPKWNSVTALPAKPSTRMTKQPVDNATSAVQLDEQWETLAPLAVKTKVMTQSERKKLKKSQKKADVREDLFATRDKDQPVRPDSWNSVAVPAEVKQEMETIREQQLARMQKASAEGSAAVGAEEATEVAAVVLQERRALKDQVRETSS